MIIELTPKQRFQEDEDILREFRTMVGGNKFKDAIGTALLQFVVESTPTSDELRGAKTFIRTFLNLGEIDQPHAEFPKKTLAIITDTRKKTEPTKPS